MMFYIATGLDANQSRTKEMWKNASFVGLKENNKDEMNYTIYPNPFKDDLTINFDILDFEGGAQLQLMELVSGRIIDTLEITQSFGTKLFHTESLAAGVYVLSLKQNNKPSKNFKVIHIK